MVALRQKQNGFTLIEMLVYLSLLVIISSAAITFMITMGRVFVQYQAEKVLASQTESILDTIIEAVRNSTTVDTTASTFVTTPGTLVLLDSSNDTTFTLTGGVVTKSVNGAAAVALNQTSVAVSNLRFFHYANAKTEAIRVTFTAATTVNGITYSHTYQTSSVIRGSYE